MISTNINPDFKETKEQRDFRQTYMAKLNAVYKIHDALGVMDLVEYSKVTLQDIYVPLRYSKQNIEETRDWEDDSGTISQLEMLKEEKHVIVSGKPGSGKTTVSRMIINLLSGNAVSGLQQLCGRRIPLYFKLRDYSIAGIESAEDLLNKFIKSQSATLRFDIIKEYIKFYLNKGWCFLIFDGVDEVGGIENRMKIREIILSYFAKYNPENYLLVTSRPSGLENTPLNSYIDEIEAKKQQLEILKLYHVDSFLKSQVEEFSKKWFALREENPELIKKKSEEFISDIAKIPSLSVLKRRPVFLTMMAHIHTTKGKLPHSRAQAYDYMVQTYVEQLDNVRRLDKTMYKDEKFYNWSFEDKVRLLQSIAYKFHSSSEKDNKEAQIVYDKKQLITIIESTIKANSEKYSTIEPEHARQLLKFYLSRTGLLHEPEDDKIQFSHLSFQEYLTARYIYRRLIEDGLFNPMEIVNDEIVIRLSKEHWGKWSETILLFFSIHKEAANDILKQIQKNNKKNYYFNLLVMKMLDSDEYGIKDSQLEYWIKPSIEFICDLDKDTDKQKYRDSKGAELIMDYFKSVDRKQKIELTTKALHKLFDLYFDEARKNNKDISSIKRLEILLYFIVSNKIIVLDFREKLKSRLPILLDRKKYGLTFTSASELFAFLFEDEFIQIAYNRYTINESAVVKHFTSFSLYYSIINIDKSPDWKINLQSLIWLIENAYAKSSYSLLKRNNLKLIDNYLGKMIKIDETSNFFWNKFWYVNIWYKFSGGLSSTNSVRKTLRFSLMLRGSINMIVSQIKEFMHVSNSRKHEIQEIDSERKTKHSNLLMACYSIACRLISEKYLHDKSPDVLVNPWNTFKDFEEFYNLLCNPEELYKHLCDTSTEEIDKTQFINEYKEYDNEIYSARNMAEEIIKAGEEHYNKYSVDEAIEGCFELINRYTPIVEEEQEEVRRKEQEEKKKQRAKRKKK